MALAGVQGEQSVLQLNWSELGGHVVVTPQDQDRYVVRMRTAIERINRGQDFDAYMGKVRLLQRILGDWLKNRKDVSQAFLTFRDGGLLFLVVNVASRYDESFDDELTDLDIKVAGDADLQGICLDVLALPNTSNQAVEHFLDDCFSLKFPAPDA